MDPNNQTNIPLGLDLNNFLPGKNNNINNMNINDNMNNNNNINIPYINESEDPKILDDITRQAPNFKVIISNRIKNLTSVSNKWDKGRNKAEAFDSANIIGDIATLNDIFNFAFVKTEAEYVDVRSKDIITVMPTIITMCGSKYDIYFKNGVLTAWKILKMFGEVIINMKQNQYLGMGIDISKEDKLRKYDIIIEYFYKLYNMPVLAQRLQGKQIEGLDLQRFVGELKYFLSKCKGK